MAPADVVIRREPLPAHILGNRCRAPKPPVRAGWTGLPRGASESRRMLKEVYVSSRKGFRVIDGRSRAAGGAVPCHTRGNRVAAMGKCQPPCGGATARGRRGGGGVAAWQTRRRTRSWADRQVDGARKRPYTIGGAQRFATGQSRLSSARKPIVGTPRRRPVRPVPRACDEHLGCEQISPGPRATARSPGAGLGRRASRVAAARRRSSGPPPAPRGPSWPPPPAVAPSRGDRDGRS